MPMVASFATNRASAGEGGFAFISRASALKYTVVLIAFSLLTGGVFVSTLASTDPVGGVACRPGGRVPVHPGPVIA